MIPALLVFGGGLATGNLDTNVAGTVEGGSTLLMANVEKGTLSATVTVDCETNTLTMYGEWQGSNDNSTWYRVRPANNAVEVVLATGTGGADASVTVVLSAPDGVYGFRYGRLGIRNEVTTGAAVDTYSIGYNYQRAGF
jgi:hypothetical protein